MWSLFRAPAKKDRYPRLFAFELPLMEELRSGQGRDGHCGYPLLLRREDGCSSRFIMVLDEAQKLPLVGHVRVQMEPNALRAAMLQAVVESLVIAIVESLLLQLPLQVPVRLRDEQKLRMRLSDGGNHLDPV